MVVGIVCVLGGWSICNAPRMRGTTRPHAFVAFSRHTISWRPCRGAERSRCADGKGELAGQVSKGDHGWRTGGGGGGSIRCVPRAQRRIPARRDRRQPGRMWRIVDLRRGAGPGRWGGGVRSGRRREMACVPLCCHVCAGGSNGPSFLSEIDGLQRKGCTHFLEWERGVDA